MTKTVIFAIENIIRAYLRVGFFTFNLKVANFPKLEDKSKTIKVTTISSNYYKPNMPYPLFAAYKGLSHVMLIAFIADKANHTVQSGNKALRLPKLIKTSRQVPFG